MGTAGRHSHISQHPQTRTTCCLACLTTCGAAGGAGRAGRQATISHRTHTARERVLRAGLRLAAGVGEQSRQHKACGGVRCVKYIALALKGC